MECSSFIPPLAHPYHRISEDPRQLSWMQLQETHYYLLTSPFLDLAIAIVAGKSGRSAGDGGELLVCSRAR